MQKHRESAEEISRKAAIKAAARAVASIKGEQQKSKSSNGDVFALYMWGSLAAASMLLALATGIFSPIGSSNSPTDVVAENSTPNTTKNQDVAGLQLPIVGVGDSGLSRSKDGEEKIVSILDTNTTGAIGGTATESAEQPAQQPEVQEPYPVVPTGDLAASIGKDVSIESLEKRFLSLKKRAPDLFAAINPKILSPISGNSGQNQLIAGPFETGQQVAAFCRSIKLKLTIDCDQSRYIGEPLFPAER